MKILCVALLAGAGFLAATAFGDEPKNFRVELASAKIGANMLDAGQYRMLVHRDGGEAKVVLTEVKTGNVTEVAAKVESGTQKYERTEVHSKEVNGVRQINEIRLGGTSLRIAFD